MTEIATSSAMVIQNSALTEIFLITGQLFWGLITLIGILTIFKIIWREFKPTKK